MLISSTQPRGSEAPPIASAAVRRTNQVAYWLLSPILTRIIAYCGGANFEPPTITLFHPRLSTPIRVNPCTIQIVRLFLVSPPESYWPLQHRPELRHSRSHFSLRYFPNIKNFKFATSCSLLYNTPAPSFLSSTHLGKPSRKPPPSPNLARFVLHTASQAPTLP